MFVMVNGQLHPSQSPCILPTDRGLTLGHGVFETILVSQGRPLLLSHHWQRLEAGATSCAIRLPLDFSGLQQQVQRLLASNQAEASTCALRISVTDGVSERGLLADGTQSATVILSLSALSTSSANTLSACQVRVRRNEQSPSSRIKSLSYLDNILARQEAQARGFDEAVMLNSQGMVADGAISNLYLIKEAQVFTPSVENGALPGVIRHLLVYELNLVKERSLRIEDFHEADAVFVSNALMGIKAIHKLDTREFNSDNPLITMLKTRLAEKRSQ
ncbi:aminotransferase class IV [Legionella sp. CNM-4043-24]|uniref:aminotransferase class IV n=1 Tax=Legionella sp. CNM-4043-24 TaxID=3421646 RepID=UPI00403A83FA